MPLITAFGELKQDYYKFKNSLSCRDLVSKQNHQHHPKYRALRRFSRSSACCEAWQLNLIPGPTWPHAEGGREPIRHPHPYPLPHPSPPRIDVIKKNFWSSKYFKRRKIIMQYFLMLWGSVLCVAEMNSGASASTETIWFFSLMLMKSQEGVKQQLGWNFIYLSFLLRPFKSTLWLLGSTENGKSLGARACGHLKPSEASWAWGGFLRAPGSSAGC